MSFTRRKNWAAFVIAVCLTGCTGLGTNARRIPISAVVVNPDYLELAVSDPIGLSRTGVLLEVIEPETLKNKALFVVLEASAGQSRRVYGNSTLWNKMAGAECSFLASPGDIIDGQPAQIYGDKVKKLSWPNKSPEPTPGSVTPAAQAPGAPPPSAAQL